MTESTAVNIDLLELQDIMDDLQDPPPGAEKRKNALTKDDIIIIARIVQAVSHKSCTRGLTEDEVDKWKFMVNAFNKGILAIGWLVLSTVVVACLSAAGWAIKHGIIEIAGSANKGVPK